MRVGSRGRPYDARGDRRLEYLQHSVRVPDPGRTVRRARAMIPWCTPDPSC
ncbi:hypothetical protein Cus16_2316 [Curtobacterium sp. ER1/6]|nr:hypothetical protein Cus16_2316 [Curtobacterium sp. ER1/6]